MSKKRIIFFGSGDFPRTTFIEMVEDNKCDNGEYKIIGLVTSFDKCEDKGKTLREIAESNKIPHITVKDCISEELEDWCRNLDPDMFVVISFKKITVNLLQLVNGKAFNIHASILPFLKGANPIRWAIRNKLKNTGLTAISLSDKIDCGDILDNIIVDINDDDNYGTLKEKLSALCPSLTKKVISNFEKYTPIKQTNCGIESKLFKAPKLTREYHRPYIGEDLCTLLKSLEPYDGIKGKIVVSERVPTKERLIGHTYQYLTSFDCTIWKLHHNKDGEDTKMPIVIGLLPPSQYYVDEIQIEGKKRMKIDEFVNGFKYLKHSKEDKGLKFKKYNVSIELSRWDF